MAELSKTAWIKRAAEGFVKHAKEGLGYGATHPKHIEAERLKKIKKESLAAATKAWYARQKAGKGRGISLWGKGPVPEVKPKTLRPTAGSEKMGRWTTEEPKIPSVERAKNIAAKKAVVDKAKKKGERLKADREIARGKTSSGSYKSPATRKREEALKKGMKTRTASKKVKLGKSRYHIKNPDSTREVVYVWDANKNKFVVKKGRPSKKGSTYEGERPPRTESGELAKTDPAKKKLTKEQQLEKTRRTLDKDLTPKGKGLKRPPAPKELPPKKKKKKKEKDKPYNAGKKAGR